MTKRKNLSHQSPDQDSIQAPSSLLPSVLARLGLDEPRSAPNLSLEALKAALSSPLWTVRVEAVHELANLHDPESFALLFPALRDEDPSVRATAMRVLGMRGDLADPATFAHLEAALLDPDWHVHETALCALGMQERLANPAPLREAIHMNSDKRKESIMVEDTRIVSEEHTLAMAEVSTPSRVRPGSHHAARRRPLWRLVASGLAAVLVLSFVTAWFAQAHFSHLSPNTHLAAFSDASALQLGAPLYSFQSNPSPLISQSQLPSDQPQFARWSADGRFFSSLQVNLQGNGLQVRILDTASGRAATYPVLDSSWVPTGQLKDSFELVGNDLVAFRPQEKSSATMVIWDIIGQRQLAKQTVPTFHDQSGNVTLPFIVPTQDEQNFALYVPGGSLEIWDTASGQRLVTCQGLLSGVNIWGQIEWYNHDQEVLSVDQNGHLQAWNAGTGKALFSQNDPARTYYEVAISPNSKYLALEIGPQDAFRSSEPPIESVEILDAFTGKVLRTDLQNSTLDGFLLAWLPDNQHLRSTYQVANGSKEQMRVWDAFTNQESLNMIVPGRSGFFTRNSQYLVLENADNTSLEILQPSNGRKIATVTMPDYAPTYKHSILSVTDKNVILLQDNTIYIWSAPMGQLLYKYHGSMPYPSTGNRGAAVFLSPDGRYLALIGYPDAQSNTATTDIWPLF